jgi:hypothetical protein
MVRPREAVYGLLTSSRAGPETTRSFLSFATLSELCLAATIYLGLVDPGGDGDLQLANAAAVSGCNDPAWRASALMPRLWAVSDELD